MQVLLTSEQIARRVAELAAELSRDFARRPVTIVGVLTGCLIFLADLIRRLDFPTQIHLVQASSYRGETTRPDTLHLNLDGLPDLKDKEVLLIDDILDTGRTISQIAETLRIRGARSVRTAVLLHKVSRQEVEFHPNYVGFTIPDAFVVGYGLDYDGDYRHLPFIGVLSDEDSQKCSGDAPDLQAKHDKPPT
ncbi:MAG: hypoxanthine phosphoribosyltransferase [Gemmataceae bacterium]